VAAPTAGLHFDEPLLEKLREKGIEMAFVTLHVARGPSSRCAWTALKITSCTLSMPKCRRRCRCGAGGESARQPRDRGGHHLRAFAGERGAGGEKDLIEPFFGDTQIFIYPGYQYKVIDALVTNFHLPESTLIMLVSAFAGYQHTMNAYKAAVEQKYRFFSYGDAMFITYNPQAIFERVGE
jgi:S-adenosylmethionine:tRNA ribosyltransferase-isomerase